jgi:hypothetical protein
MQSTQTLPDADPHDTFVIEPDVVLAARADKDADKDPVHRGSPDPVHEVLSLLSHRRAQMASAAPIGAPMPTVGPTPLNTTAPNMTPPNTTPLNTTPTVDTTFRATNTAAGEPSAMGRWTRRVTIAFLFTFCSALAAATWNDHGEAARQMIANWLPPFALAALPAIEKPAAAEQPAAPVQAAAAEPAPAQPAPPAAVAEAAAPAPAAVSAESTQLLQSMAHDLSAMGQQIEQLKASIEQIKAGQAQMSREMSAKAAARTSERTSETRAAETRAAERSRLSAASPRPLAAPPRYPRPAYYPPAQAAYTPPLPPPAPPPVSPQPALSQPAPLSQPGVQPDGEPVVRPPMPLR